MAAPSIIQMKVARATSAAASLDCTFDTTPGVGRGIVAFGFASGGLPTIANNQGNTDTQHLTEGFDAIWGRTWTAPAATSSGSYTMTLTPSSGTQILTLVLFEIANWNASSPIEKSGKHWQSGPPTTDYSPLNFTGTTAAEQLFLAALAGQAGFSRTISASTDWTQEHQYASTSGHSIGVISRTVTSTGTYDPEFDLSSGGIEFLTQGISLVGGSDGPPPGGGANDLVGAAIAGAAASAALTTQRNLASAAVAGALATGAISITRALSTAAIGQALGQGVLEVFSQVWRVPTNAPNGTAVHLIVLSGASPTYTVLAQGIAVVAGGFADIPGGGAPAGTKVLAFVHNYNDNTATSSIRGGPAIATLTDI